MWDAERKLGARLVRPEYFLVGGSLPSGVLLNQIVYWFRPSKNGKTKVVIEREGLLWIAKTRMEWCKECFLSEWELRVSLKSLEDKGIIIARVFRFAGVPTLHISLVLGQLWKLVLVHCPPIGVMSSKVSGSAPDSEPTSGTENTDFQNGEPLSLNLEKSSTQSEGTLTPILEESSVPYKYELNTELNTELNLAKPSSSPLNDVQNSTQNSEETEIPTLAEQLMKKAKDSHGLAMVWKNQMSKSYGGWVKPLSVKQYAQLKKLREVLAGQDSDSLVRFAIENWPDLAPQLRSDLGLLSTPDKPDVGLILLGVETLVAYKEKTDSQQLIAKEITTVQQVPMEKSAKIEPVSFTPEEIAAQMADLWPSKS